MNEIEVSIVELPPMRVASVYGFGEQPELQAWERLIAYAKPKGFLGLPEQHRIFGFNNPDPSHGSPNYGYELWIQVGAEAEPESEVRIEDFAGGLYAVTRCAVMEGNFDLIGQTWKQLVTWREDSRYEFGGHQWLEEAIRYDRMEHGEMILDLFMPIVE